VGSLRSWIKQERLTAGTSGLNPTLRTAALLLVLLIGLEGLRRYHTTRQQLEQRQQEQLQLLQSLVRDNQRPLKDWAQWDEIYAFSEGRQPDFVERLMRTTALLDGGAVMAIHDGQGRLLALEGADRRDRSPSSPLIRCLAGVTQQRQRQAADHLPVICPSQAGPLVGGIASITDTLGNRRSQASLTYLVPLLSPGDGSQLQSGLVALSRQLVFNPADGTAAAAGRRPVQPPLWTMAGRQLQVRQPSLAERLQGEWLALGALVSGGALVGLLLRMRWMLGQRRFNLAQRRQERRLNQRIRSTERELSRLLDQVQIGGDGSDTMAFARLLERRDTRLGSIGQDHGRLEQLAERFELVLQTARSLALFDPTTGLPNRSYFLERLHWETERSRRSGMPLVLLFINIDKFKQINEAYGHNTGDDTLRHIADELRRLIHSNDFLARFGGDEFGLILHPDGLESHDTAPIREAAHQRALQLIDGYRDRSSSQPERLKISLSIGIAISDAGDTTPEELIRRSDLAMVMAKTGPQKHVSVFDIERDWDGLNNYRLFNALQSDLSHAPERFRILFQPIVDPDGELLKVEALARWSNPDFPAVPPDVFFALAERYRLMPELGRLLLDTTLRDLKQLRQELGRPDLALALNVSASQLSLQGFGTLLLAELSEQRIAPESVTLEITESAVVEPSPALTNNLSSLRRAGMRLALDDFGTGYSSLRLLMWLKPDELKIDKSFVIAAAADCLARQIVRLLHALAQEMELTLVAEGVEDDAMFQLLRDVGIDHFQGYLFCQPLSRHDLVTGACRFPPHPPVPAA